MSLEINFPVQYVDSVKLAKVVPGGCFAYEGQLFMRTIISEEGDDMCINLQNGELKHLDPDTHVVSLYLKISGI